MEKIAIIYGTRPEFLKVYPIILEAERLGINLLTINTGQHSDILSDMERLFEFSPSYKLEVQSEGLNSSELLAKLIKKVGDVVKIEKVNAIVSQGDTFTVLASALVSFLERINFYHVEAGLRTQDIYSPFPEEFNRRVVSLVSNINFAPTEKSKANLKSEGVGDDQIVVCGNTIIDMLKLVLDKESVRVCKNDKVLVTAHRRENIGDNLNNICHAIRELVLENPKITFYWSLHPNPSVQEFVLSFFDQSLKNLEFIKPLNYVDNVKLMSECLLIISDSGGIQEEVPTLGKKILILRNETERPEVLECGSGVLVGANIDKIKKEFYRELLSNEIYAFNSPFGDGNSSRKIMERIMNDLN